MDTSSTKKSFNKRAFVSIAMFLAGLCLPVSGLINHLLANEPMTLGKHLWMTIHNIAGILFLVFAILHISLNWNILIKYIQKAMGIVISREALAAIALIVLIVGLFSSHAFH